MCCHPFSNLVVLWLMHVNQVPITATPTRVKNAHGEYVFAAEPLPHAIFYVRMVRGTPLGACSDV